MHLSVGGASLLGITVRDFQLTVGRSARLVAVQPPVVRPSRSDNLRRDFPTVCYFKRICFEQIIFLDMPPELGNKRQRKIPEFYLFPARE